MKDNNKSEKILRTCELTINFLLALGLLYAIFSVQELKNQTKYLELQNFEFQIKIHQLEKYCYFDKTSDGKESTSVRILSKREIYFNGEETYKKMTNEDRLAKGFDESPKTNESLVPPQTVNTFNISNFERLKDIQMEKPIPGNLTVHMTTTTTTTSQPNEHRKSHKERAPRKKFQSGLLVQEQQLKENRHKEANRAVAIHYSASLANHSLRHHPLHKGNGLVTLPSSLYQYWIPVSWTEDLGMSNNFFLNGSDIKVNRSGLYLIYCQIQYLTSGKKDDNGYKIYRNSEPIAQCIFTKTVERDKLAPQTCSLTTVAALSSDDKIFLRDISHKPTVALSPEKSFLGLILITPT